MGQRILIVDDDADLRDLVTEVLSKKGYTVLHAADGSAGVEMAMNNKPDLVVLDNELPGLNGFQVCSLLRSHSSTRTIPILFLSIQATTVDVVSSFRAGGNDYVRKPFSAQELLVRVGALLRRASDNSEESFEFGGIELDCSQHRVMVDGKEVALTPSEFQLLHVLIRRPNYVSERTQLLDFLDSQITSGERSVDFHITGLRKKLGEKGDLIKTVRGVGYKLSCSN